MTQFLTLKDNPIDVSDATGPTDHVAMTAPIMVSFDIEGIQNTATVGKNSYESCYGKDDSRGIAERGMDVYY
jgi:hypothetical protein